MIHLPSGDPSKPAQMEAHVEEDDEREGSMATDLTVANSQIGQLASSLQKSG
ncbi:hypothetical protein A2U01_0030364 [Trifolium medium]|uniref:Uncharacterized protein n=1 Tax=Trifolium medium TaxID=97028 RepID=A0A392PCT0_9FABA|nr:hypothetical protein [Trifolium medium]